MFPYICLEVSLLASQRQNNDLEEIWYDLAKLF